MNQRLLPRYIQFANQIQSHIQDGIFPVGSSLPAQRELAQQFGTTLMTIRKALGVLEEEGMIRTEHGVGTFVLDPQVQEDDFQLFSLSNEMKQQAALIMETRIITAVSQHSHQPANQALNLPDGDLVGMIERVRLMDGVPFMTQRSYLPPHLAQLVERYDPTSSLYEFLRQENGRAITLAKELIQPILLTTAQAVALQTEPNSPAWRSIRLSSDQDGTPLLYDEAILKQAYFIVTIEHIGKRSHCKLQLRQPDDGEGMAWLKE